MFDLGKLADCCQVHRNHMASFGLLGRPTVFPNLAPKTMVVAMIGIDHHLYRCDNLQDMQTVYDWGEAVSWYIYTISLPFTLVVEKD